MFLLLLPFEMVIVNIVNVIRHGNASVLHSLTDTRRGPFFCMNATLLL